MRINIIAAVSENNVIGKNGKLPWHLSNDLKRFKRLTLNKPVVMGRKTFESIGRPLPQRRNIVLSTTLSNQDGIEVFNSLNACLKRLDADKVDEIFIIGGERLYKETLNLADKLFLTRVHTKIEDGDAFFPEIGSDWKNIKNEFHPKDEQNDFDYSFEEYISLLEKT